MQRASSTRRNADIARNCPSVHRMAAKSARLRRCSSWKMGNHRLVIAPGTRTQLGRRAQRASEDVESPEALVKLTELAVVQRSQRQPDDTAVNTEH